MDICQDCLVSGLRKNRSNSAALEAYVYYGDSINFVICDREIGANMRLTQRPVNQTGRIACSLEIGLTVPIWEVGTAGLGNPVPNCCS